LKSAAGEGQPFRLVLICAELACNWLNFARSKSIRDLLDMIMPRWAIWSGTLHA
jgi:hypothetical protein